MIGDRDLEVTSGVRAADRFFRRSAHFRRRRRTQPPLRHRFARIDHQGVDHLLDLAGIDFRFAEVILDLDRGAQIRAVEGEFRGVLQQVGD